MRSGHARIRQGRISYKPFPENAFTLVFEPGSVTGLSEMAEMFAFVPSMLLDEDVVNVIGVFSWLLLIFCLYHLVLDQTVQLSRSGAHNPKTHKPRIRPINKRKNRPGFSSNLRLHTLNSGTHLMQLIGVVCGGDWVEQQRRGNREGEMQKVFCSVFVT